MCIRNRTNIQSVVVLQGTYSFSKYIKEVCSLQEAQDSPNTLATFRTFLKSIGPIGYLRRGYLLSSFQVHATTHCRFNRDQYWTLHLLRSVLAMMVHDQVYRLEGSPKTPRGDALSSSVGMSSGNIHQYPASMLV